MQEKMTQYHELVEKTREVFLTAKTRDVEFRKRQLKALLRMYEENEEAFCSALAKDLRKPKQESILLEINFLKDDIRHILARLDDWAQPRKIPANLLTLFDKPMIYNDPYGVVLIMGAWNYPIQLAMLPVSGAIAAGNCVILKPSEVSPATSEAIERLLPKYLDNDCYRVVCGGIPETTELLKERFDYIFYTGSPVVGKIVREAANKHLTPTTLELGGKSPLYIDDSVNMDVAIRRILWGKFINAGQTCIAPDYVLCTKEVQEKFVSMASEVLREWYGDKPKESPDLCRIITEKHVNRLQGYLKDGKVAIGGDVDLSEKWVAPTVMVDVPPDSKLMTEEIFGPILPVVNVSSAYDAIRFINARDHPLCAYIFTTNSEIQKMFLESISCGSVCINDTIVQYSREEKPLVLYAFSQRTDVLNLLLENTSSGGACINDTVVHLSVHDLPFGGIGNSGMGAYHGKASFDTFTHKKSCLIRNYNKIADAIGKKRYPPYNESNLNFLSKMLRETNIPGLKYLPYVLTFGLGVAAAFAVNAIAKAAGSDDD